MRSLLHGFGFPHILKTGNEDHSIKEKIYSIDIYAHSKSVLPRPGRVSPTHHHPPSLPRDSAVVVQSDSITGLVPASLTATYVPHLCFCVIINIRLVTCDVVTS